MKTLKQLLEAKGREVYTIEPGARVFDALKMMADKGVGALMVTEGGRIAGVVSDCTVLPS